MAAGVASVRSNNRSEKRGRLLTVGTKISTISKKAKSTSNSKNIFTKSIFNPPWSFSSSRDRVSVSRAPSIFRVLPPLEPIAIFSKRVGER